jgi:hypothetical protein
LEFSSKLIRDNSGEFKGCLRFVTKVSVVALSKDSLIHTLVISLHPFKGTSETQQTVIYLASSGLPVEWA